MAKFHTCSLITHIDFGVQFVWIVYLQFVHLLFGSFSSTAETRQTFPFSARTCLRASRSFTAKNEEFGREIGLTATLKNSL